MFILSNKKKPQEIILEFGSFMVDISPLFPWQLYFYTTHKHTLSNKSINPAYKPMGNSL